MSEASDEELAQTAYFGRRVLSELGDIFKIRWLDDEYLDILGALLGPMLCVMFSDSDKPIHGSGRTFSRPGRVRLHRCDTTKDRLSPQIREPPRRAVNSAGGHGHGSEVPLHDRRERY